MAGRLAWPPGRAEAPSSSQLLSKRQGFRWADMSHADGVSRKMSLLLQHLSCVSEPWLPDDTADEA